MIRLLALMLAFALFVAPGALAKKKPPTQPINVNTAGSGRVFRMLDGKIALGRQIPRRPEKLSLRKLGLSNPPPKPKNLNLKIQEKFKG